MALAGALVFTAAACKNNNTNTPTTNAPATLGSPVAQVGGSGGAGGLTATPMATTAAATVAAATPAAAGASTPAAGSPAAGAADANKVTEVTTDNKFSVTAMTATVNVPFTVTVENHGTAIHNWALADTAGVTGTTMTGLAQPAKSESATMTFTKAGTYKFNCQVHPTEMIGTVTVH